MVTITTAPSTLYPKLTYDIVVNGKPSGYIWRLEDDNEFNVLVGEERYSHIGTLDSAIASLKAKLEDKDKENA